MAQMKWYDSLAYFLLVVGGLNWGLTLFNFNLVDWIFGAGAVLGQVVYGLVGIAALYGLYMFVKLLKD